MRVRITQRLDGSIDGIKLSRFMTGLTYDVGTTLANYLLAQGFAVPVDDASTALVLPIQDCSELPTPSSKSPVSEAADRAPRRKGESDEAPETVCRFLSRPARWDFRYSKHFSPPALASETARSMAVRVGLRRRATRVPIKTPRLGVRRISLLNHHRRLLFEIQCG